MMLARVADSLYWIGRYIERAEHLSRLSDVMLQATLDQSEAAAQAVHVALAAVGEDDASLGDRTPFDAARDLVLDREDYGSVVVSLARARENARQVREEISTEQWQRLNRLFHHVRSPQAQAQFRNSVGDLLASIVDGIHLFKGVSDTTMIHGQGWQFIRLGRYLERAYSTATLLEVYQPDLFCASEREHSGYQYLEQVGLLRCCTAFEAYCQVYTADISADRILEFLLLNRDFPHAIRYAVDCIRSAVESIQRSGARRPPEDLTAGIGRLHAMLGYTTIGEILAGNPGRFLHSIRQQCIQIHELVYRVYIQYSIQSALAV